jgi:drug/metabolite transporter (DMT)-like permease
MAAILGGLGAALAWTLSTLFSSRSSRLVDPAGVVAWMAIVGLVVIAPFVLADGVPSRLDAGSAGWLAVAGAGNILGLLLVYVAYREGAAVVLIAPLVATEGAIAAVISIVGGERVSVAVAVTLAAIAAGISLAAVPPARRTGAPLQDVAAEASERASRSHGEHSGRVLSLAAVAAISFGFSLYATGHVSSKLPLAWVILPARLVGTVIIAMPLLALGRLRPRQVAPAWRLVVGAGICEVLGFASYTIGARHDVAVAAVVACQFAALSALAAFVLFGERLGRVQLAGVAVLLIGISVLSGITG